MPGGSGAAGGAGAGTGAAGGFSLLLFSPLQIKGKTVHFESPLDTTKERS